MRERVMKVRQAKGKQKEKQKRQIQENTEKAE